MKNRKWTMGLAVALCCSLFLQACTGISGNVSDSEKEEAGLVESGIVSNSEAVTFTVSASQSGYSDTDYVVPTGISEKREGVDYGVMDDRISYYSSTVGENKECGVLLPAGYHTGQKYPVVYILHGNGGDHYDWNRDDRFLQTLVGNMTADGLMVPSVIVMVDMWTAPKALKENPTIDTQLAAYDELYKDLRDNLIPYIVENYSVMDSREGTAIIGTSQGGTESLVAGFSLLDNFGYISALAPCPGVIAMPDYPSTAWNTPVLDDFVIPEGKKPYYLALTVGDKDPWCIQSTQFYDQVMTEQGIQHDYQFVEGLGHEDALWQNGIYNFLKRIFQ